MILKKHFVFIVFWVCFQFLCIFPLNAFDFRTKFSCSGKKVSLCFKTEEAKRSFNYQKYDNKIRQIIKNLYLFEKDFFQTETLQSIVSEFHFLFTKSDSPFWNLLEIKAITLTSSISENIPARFWLKNLRFDKNDNLISFEIQIDKKEGLGEIYYVLNIQIDAKNDILERMILFQKLKEIPSIKNAPLQKCFVFGILSKYQRYDALHNPMAFQTKKFLIDYYGVKRIIQVVEGIQRLNDPKKMIIRRHDLEADFQKQEKLFSMCNVEVDSEGRVVFYDLLLPIFFKDKIYKNMVHFDVRFLKYHGEGFLNKLIRKFKWTDERKHYLSGIALETKLSIIDVEVQSMIDKYFHIKTGKSGLFDKERIMTHAFYSFPVKENVKKDLKIETERNFKTLYKTFEINGKQENLEIFE